MRHFLPVCILTGLSFFVCLSSCQLANIGDPIVVADVEEEFEIIALEKLSPDERSLMFEIETLNDEPCDNALIDARLTKVSYQLRISLQDIIAPTDCIPGSAPARTSLDAGPLDPGYYQLTIDLKSEVINDGQLTVRGDRYLINMETTNGFALTNKELLRIPDNTIWGYAAYETADDQALAGEFREAVAAMAEAGDFRVGYYGHFQQTADQILLREAPREDRILQFAYHYSGTDEAMQKLVDQYRATYSDRLELRIFNDDGEVF